MVWSLAKTRDLTRLAMVSFATLAIAWWVQACVQANWDAADLLPALFMDELVTHNEVERIQNADNINTYLDTVVGRDQRYGRTHWYLAYVASTAGEAVLGVQGQVFFTRMAFAMTLVAGICLLSITFLRSTPLRLLSIVIALATPFSSYFATMPKPEPILLFCLSVYFLLSFKRGQYLGLSFIWLGLAYGTKISALPAVLVLLCYCALRSALESKNAQIWATQIATSVGAFVVGALAAVPVIIAKGLEGWKIHLQGTWLNRTHGTDSTDVGPTEWLRYIQQDAFFGNGPVTWVVLTVFVVTITGVAILAVEGFKNDPTLNRLRKTLVSREAEILVLFIVALSFIAPILISVQRIWGFYLFGGVAMLTIAALAAGEHFFFRKTNKRIRLGMAAALMIASSIAVYAGGTHSKNKFDRMAARSDGQAYKENALIYNEIVSLAAALKPLSSDGSAVVYFDPRLWRPQNDAGVTFKPIWVPFNNWKAKSELVVLKDRWVIPATYKPRGTSYDDQVAASFKSVRQHSNLDGPCTAEPCYIHEDGPSAGLHFFFREDLYNALRKSQADQ